MARRPKQQSLLELAIIEDWWVSAIFAVGLSLIMFVVLPTLTNPLLKGLMLGLRPLGFILIAVFGLIAVFKYFRQQVSNKKFSSLESSEPYKSDSWRENSNLSTKAMEKEYHTSISRNRAKPSQEPPGNWSLKLIQDIEWKKFEELSTTYYREKGIKAEATSLGADGGIDIKLYQDDSGVPTSIVQCKAWSSRRVGVKQIREFLGVMSHEKIAQGFYMTSGKYSNDAMEIAKANRITLITGEMLLMMIKRLPSDAQKRLLDMATEGDYKTPSCPSCGIKMVRRSSRHGDFWGCKNFPGCNQRLHVKSLA